MKQFNVVFPAPRSPAPRSGEKRKRIESRRGAAFLILVVMVLLLVLAATKGLVQNELQARRGNRDWLRSQVMDSAVTRWKQANVAAPSGSGPWLLPLGVGEDEYLEVSKNEDSKDETITVRWVRGGNAMGQVIRHTAALDKEADSPPTKEEETQ